MDQRRVTMCRVGIFIRAVMFIIIFKLYSNFDDIKHIVLASAVDPDPAWIRIRTGSGFNRFSGSGSRFLIRIWIWGSESGSRRTKIIHKKKLINFMFQVLDVLF
jgi:hypothetical protein